MKKRLNKLSLAADLLIKVVTLWATILSYFGYGRTSAFLENTGVHELWIIPRMSHITRKPAFCICKNKGTDQLL